MERILIIDDDPDVCMLLKRFLTRKDYEVLTANSGATGIRAAETEIPDLILSDFRLGDMDGVEVLQRLQEKIPRVPVIVMTGYSDIRVAVNLMKMGAFDYLAKPIVPDEILHSIQRALSAASNGVAHHAPEEKFAESNKKQRNFPTPSTSKDYVLGRSALALALYKQVDLVAPTNYTVIVYGESGAGKESIARMIHDQSPRRQQPFVAMDCGAISRDLANSELFGHEKGSFTGALALKIGHFEMANGGTLFLDEVINLPYEVQVALLRVVQERRLKRIGGTKEIALDVRIIIASNERLSDACRNGKFREDLYHRFNEFSLEIPPLRERQDDIMMFAHSFLQQAARELNKPVNGFSDEVVQIFLQYPWYGNVRELKNVIKRAVLLAEGATIDARSLPFEIVHHMPGAAELHGPALNTHIEPPVHYPDSPVQSSPANSNPPVSPEKMDLKSAASQAEYEMIMRALHQAKFNKSMAAQHLGIDRKTLYNKLKNYNIE